MSSSFDSESEIHPVIRPDTMNNATVRVGVAAIIVEASKVLVMKRAGSHGAGTWALPGGHQEFGESPEQTAEREVLEETGFEVAATQRLGFTNDFMPDEGKHYITIFVRCERRAGEAQIMEPQKATAMEWRTIAELRAKRGELFAPLTRFLEQSPDLEQWLMANGKQSLQIRRCTANDIAFMGELARGPAWLAHCQRRYARQEAGEADYYLAWNDRDLVGQVTLLHRSKYENVRAALGAFPEMNALEAMPTGHGTGGALIAFCEDVVRARGIERIGLAVEQENVGARRLYQRLGYTPWNGGVVVDKWTELNGNGGMANEHADTCDYFVKHTKLPVGE